VALASRRSRLGFVFGGIRFVVWLGIRNTIPVGRTMFVAVPRPPQRLTGPWSVSIASLVSSHPKVPAVIARLLLRRLDKFGKVSLGPAGVGFDDKTIGWNRILEIRAYPAANHIPPSVVIDRESDRIRELLPPVPGRRWIVGKVAGVAATVVTAFTRHPPQSMETMALLPCEIVYRNVFGRRARLAAGLFAATVLAVIPEASNSLFTMAADRGVPVRVLRDEAGEVRAARSHRVRRIAAQVATRARTT
jgi:hypothetical protein